MKLADFARFKKFMELTMSDNEGEALSALRMANKLIKSEGLTWTRVLDRSIQIVPQFEDKNESEHGVTEDELEAMFEAVLDESNGSFRDVVQSIYSQWKERGFITPRQREVIVAAFRRLRR